MALSALDALDSATDDRFPAKFMLISAMNPCPCGYFGDSVKECTCSEAMVSRCQKRISGPLLDRIDIHVEVPRVQYEKLSDDRMGESSTRIRERVEVARVVQQRRFQGTKLTCNAEMTPSEVRRIGKIEPAAQSLLKPAISQLHLSTRHLSRVLRFARTIAGLIETSRSHLSGISRWPCEGDGP